MGRRLLRPPRPARSRRQHGPRLERHHLPGDRPVARDADRPPDAARDRQRRAGRPPAHLPARRQRVLRDASPPSSRRARTKTLTVYYHGRPTRRRAAALGRRAHLGARSRRPAPGSRPPARDSAPASGGPPRTPRPTSPTASGSRITVPDSLQAVGNGRLRGVDRAGDGWTTWEWFVTSPINNYDVAPYVGRYAQFTDTYDGEGGPLTLDFRPLAAHLEAAREQWKQVEADAPVLRALVRSLSLVPRRLPADRGAAPRHGAPERGGVRQRLPERVQGHRSVRHRLGPDVGLHRDPRERPRVVGQQHHDRRHGRHVGARELRQLLGVALHRVPVRAGGGRRVRAGHPAS